MVQEDSELVPERLELVIEDGNRIQRSRVGRLAVEPVGEPCHLFRASTIPKKCRVFTQDSTVKCRASGSGISLDNVVREQSNAGGSVAQGESKHTNRPAPAPLGELLSRGRIFAWHANQILRDPSKQHEIGDILSEYRPYYWTIASLSDSCLFNRYFYSIPKSGVETHCDSPRLIPIPLPIAFEIDQPSKAVPKS